MKSKYLIFIALIAIILTSGLCYAAEDYYVESSDFDYNVTVPVNVNANNVSYLLVELESGFSPSGSDVYDIWDATKYESSHLGTENFNIQNTTSVFEFYLVGTASDNYYGFADTASPTDGVYFRSKTDGTDDATLYTVVDGSTASIQLRNDEITERYCEYIVNETHVVCNIYGNSWNLDYTKTLSPVPSDPINYWFEESGSGYVDDLKVRKYYDNEPTINVSQFNDNLVLVTITNPNDFALTDYQVTFDSKLADQTDESLNVTAYQTLDIPVPTSPINNTNLEFEYPPSSNEVNLTWMGNGGSSYTYEVRHIGGSLVMSGVTSNTYANVLLPAGYYYWSVESDLTETTDTIIAYFSVSNTYITDAYSAIVGVTYKLENGVRIPIQGAQVQLYNDTWSEYQISDIYGYFDYTYLPPNETYYLQATAESYQPSTIHLLTTEVNATISQDILMYESESYYNPHYVKFIVRSFTGSKYSNVIVSAYEDNNANPTFVDTTGSDGSVTFRMTENQQYRLTFVNAALGINAEKTLYPKDDEYPIIVFGTDLVPENRTQDDILFSAYGQTINLSYGYINVSFNDTSGTTILANAYIKDTNLTTLYSFNTTNSSADWSQVVEGGNSTYIIQFDIENTQLDDVLEISRTIKFNDVVAYDLGFDEGWKYIFVSCLILGLILLLASKLNSEIMAGVGVLSAWLMVGLGWLIAGLTTAETITVGLMLLLGTVIAFGTIIKRGEKEL